MTKPRYLWSGRVVTMSIAALAVAAGVRMEAASKPIQASSSEDRADPLADQYAAIGDIVGDAIGEADAKQTGPKHESEGEAQDQDHARSEIYRSLDPDGVPSPDTSAAMEQLDAVMTDGLMMDETTQVSLGEIVATSRPELNEDNVAAAALQAAGSAASAVGNNRKLVVSVTVPSVNSSGDD